MADKIDIAIVGRGLVGGITALALSKTGATIALIDKIKTEKLNSIGFDPRTSTISKTSKRMLDVLGLWKELGPFSNPILDIKVEEGGPKNSIIFSGDLAPGEPMSYVVENDKLREIIFKKIREKTNITLFDNFELKTISHSPQGIELFHKKDLKISTNLLVGADGRNSAVRRLAGFKSKCRQYHQKAIVLIVKHSISQKNTAHQLFFSPGPLAILPLKDNRSSIVWTMDIPTADKYLKLPPRNFIKELESRVGKILGSISLSGQVLSYPLDLQFAKNLVSPGITLVGDAARIIHPIAGQGLNLGLRDVAVLAEVVVDALRLGLDPGDLYSLRKYERWRSLDTAAMVASTDGINKLFSNKIPTLAISRKLGLKLVDSSNLIKRFFMRQAIGELGTLPRLLRGEEL